MLAIYLAIDLSYISEMAELVPLPHSHAQICSHSDWLHINFLSLFLDLDVVTRVSMSIVSFLAQPYEFV